MVAEQGCGTAHRPHRSHSPLVGVGGLASDVSGS